MLDRPIRNFMTRSPVLIGRGQSLAAAHAIMRGRHVRHLPVLEAGKLVGLVSLSDLHFIESLMQLRPEEVLVDEAMTTDPYVVTGATPLAAVARTMARRRLEAAVVLDDQVVAGVFTAVDALRILARLATQPGRSAAKPEPGGSAAKPRPARTRPRAGRPATPVGAAHRQRGGAHAPARSVRGSQRGQRMPRSGR